MLDNALKDFLGVGQNEFPRENSGLLLSKYGDVIHDRIQIIMADFETELMRNPSLEIGDAICIARVEISTKFPDVGMSGLDALEWAFSYWFK